MLQQYWRCDVCTTFPRWDDGVERENGRCRPRPSNRNTLANKLCDKFRGQVPRLKGFHADLFEYAIGQIVWTEVAEELLDKLSEMEG